MKKLIILALVLTFSTSVLAKTASKSLTNSEVELVIKLSNKYGVPLSVNGPCTETKFDIVDTVRGFNPATWTIGFYGRNYNLEHNEISKLIELHNRLDIPGEYINSITMKTKITIKGASCGFTPYRWTVTFDA